MKQNGETESTAATDCVAAMVVRLDFERWPELKRKVAELGGTLIYQQTAPTWVHLIISRKEREPQ